MDALSLLSIAGPTAIFTGGVAWGAVKVTLNGTKARVQRLEEQSADYADRLARIETKIDVLLDRSE
jgi:hypothetical protein